MPDDDRSDRFLGEMEVHKTLEEALEAQAKHQAMLEEGRRQRQLRREHGSSEKSPVSSDEKPCPICGNDPDIRKFCSRCLPQRSGGCVMCGGFGSIPVYGSGQADDCPACGPRY